MRTWLLVEGFFGGISDLNQLPEPPIWEKNLFLQRKMEDCENGNNKCQQQQVVVVVVDDAVCVMSWRLVL
jgi:hypothetical protein